MKEKTKKEIVKFLVYFARANIPMVPAEDIRRAYPFHTLFFDDDGLRAFKVQRSLVTKMGQQLYPKIAELVAKDRFNIVHRDHQITGKIEENKAHAIERIITDLRQGRREPDFEAEMREVGAARGGRMVERSVIADLYVEDFDPGPLFLEIKSPRPNLDVCAESKKKMLYFRALYADKNPQAYLAFPYNPFIRREDYGHGPTRRIMDLEREVLIGEEMWDLLGGERTYEEILSLIEEAKRKLGKYDS